MMGVRAFARYQTRLKHLLASSNAISAFGGGGGQCCGAENVMAVAEVSTSAWLQQQTSPPRAPIRPPSFLRPETVSPRLDVPRHIPRPPYVGAAEPPVMAAEIQIHDEAGVAGMRAAGRLAALIRDFVGSLVRPGVTTDEIDKAAHEAIIDSGAYPSLLGFGGFPKSVSTSINECICNGIPNSRALRKGDIVNIDVNVYLNGYHAETSETYICGTVNNSVQRFVQRPGLELETPIITGDGEAKDGSKSSVAQDRALAMLGLMNGALWQVISANDTDRINILQLCVKWPPVEESSTFGKETSSARPETTTVLEHEKSSDNSTPERSAISNNMISNNLVNMNGNLISLPNNGQDSSLATMLLNGQAASPKSLVANMPTALLYWPLIQLASSANEDVALGVAVGSRGGGIVEGGACDVRAALLLLLIGKCGEEFFRGLLDDSDSRIAYYTSAFLLKRMLREEPEAYQHMLHNLVFKAQQSNNEKLLENPYLQMLGILQLSSELGSTL